MALQQIDDMQQPGKQPAACPTLNHVDQSHDAACYSATFQVEVCQSDWGVMRMVAATCATACMRCCIALRNMLCDYEL